MSFTSQLTVLTNIIKKRADDYADMMDDELEREEQAIYGLFYDYLRGPNDADITEAQCQALRILHHEIAERAVQSYYEELHDL